jgi:hypothetical protein
MSDRHGELPVKFVFKYTRTHYPRRGEGAINGKEVALTDTGHCVLKTIPEDEVRLVAKLTIPGSRKTVDVVCVDGVMMRTVCKPGSFEPCSFVDFLAAATDGTKAFRDSPFQPPVDRDDKVEVIGPKFGMRDFDSKRWDDDSTENEMRRDAVARAADYAVIGARVYRKCEEPMLGLFWRKARDQRFHLLVGWRFPELDVVTHPVAGEGWGGGSLGREAIDYYDETGLFRLDRVDGARALAEKIVEIHPHYAEGGNPMLDWSPVAKLVPSELRREDDAILLERTLRSCSKGLCAPAWCEGNSKTCGPGYTTGRTTTSCAGCASATC